MKYFTVETIKQAIEHLQNFSANWLLPAFVFAANKVGTAGEKLREKVADMRHYLREAHGFAAMSPRGKENIATALEILDELGA